MAAQTGTREGDSREDSPDATATDSGSGSAQAAREASRDRGAAPASTANIGTGSLTGMNLNTWVRIPVNPKDYITHFPRYK